MNKIGVSLLSALATLGIVGGAGAIALSTPVIKEKLNISFADNVLFGKDNKKEQIPEVKPEKPEVEKEETFSQGLANRNLMLVNYQIDDETIIRIQEMGTSVELFEVPSVAGCTFIGWSETQTDRKLVGIAENNMTLYPVYINNDYHYTFNMYTLDSDYTEHINTASKYFGRTLTNYSSALNSFTTYLLGFTDSADSKDMMTSFTNSLGTLYPVVYHKETKQVYSYNEWKEQYAIYQCGQNALNNVKLHTFNAVEETKAYKANVSVGSILDIDGLKFTLTGFSMSGDSTSLVSPSSMIDGKSYYAVYEAQQNYKTWSLNELKNGWDIVVHTSGPAMQIQCKHYEDLGTYIHRFNANGIMFNLKGYSLAVDSTEMIESENLTEEYLSENEIRHLYCVYERSDTLELYSSQALNELVRYRKATYAHYILNGSERQMSGIYLLEPFEKSIVVNDVAYDFYGWSEDVGSVLIVDTDVNRNYYHLYAVYKNVETGEIVPISSILI